MGGAAALLLLSLACIVATVIVYFALVIRKVLIVVTAIFAPLAFAGSLADITVSWTRRWIETTVALIVSKLILILIFVAGYGILIEGVGQAGSGTTQKVTQVISGILVLFLAGFAPWSALKIVHFTGEHAHPVSYTHLVGSFFPTGVNAPLDLDSSRLADVADIHEVADDPTTMLFAVTSGVTDVPTSCAHEILSIAGSLTREESSSPSLRRPSMRARRPSLLHRVSPIRCVMPSLSSDEYRCNRLASQLASRRCRCV